MTPIVGGQLGHYQVRALIGKGGMGEVWRALDTKLGRDVAIKSLPAEFAQDRDRRARFEREARALAALNHVNVGTIYGLEEYDGAAYLVLELIEGATLADEIAAGSLSLDRTIAIAAQIAEGLEAAHEAGIVHRDLKPANIKVGRAGSLDPPSVKILDFGLARTLDRAAASGELEQSTMMGGTVPGVILGTLAYMSPEQARGDIADRRTDIFAFGCVLYECLTGRQAFGGKTTTDALAATMTAEPDWLLLPVGTPTAVRELLRRCLQKNPRLRLQSIGDARVILRESIAAQGRTIAVAPAVVPTSATRNWPPAIVTAGALAALGIGVLIGRLLPGSAPSQAQPSPVSAVLALPANLSLNLGATPTMAFAPDGRTIVFRAVEGGTARLYRRALDGRAPQAISGTEGATDPFFSPDGQELAFFAQAQIKKISMAGGAPVTIGEASPVASGGTWTSDGAIIFARGPNDALYRVPVAGGAVEPWSRLDSSRGEHAHVWPQALPGGRMLVTMVFGKDFQDLNDARAVIVAPGEKPRDLLEGSAFARIVPGWIVFVRGEALLAAPFDHERLVVTGPPVPVSEPISIGPVRRVPHFAVSPAGTMVFGFGSPLTQAGSDLVRIDRAGRATPLAIERAAYSHLRLSPDGKQLVTVRSDGMALRLFVFDIGRQVLSPLTPEPGRFFCPVWSPDGRRIACTHFEQGEPQIVVKNVDGSDTAVRLTSQSADAEFPNTWSPDGTVLAYTVAYSADQSPTRKGGTTDIWFARVDGSVPPRPWFESPADEIAATFSPDGRFIAYVSNESGRAEVYVRPYPGPGGKIQVSSLGGTEPTWASNGREILYRQVDRFMSAAFRSQPAGTAAPRLLFAGPFDRSSRQDAPRAYDISRDGSFLVATQTARREPIVSQLGVVTNWLATLSRSTAGGR